MIIFLYGEDTYREKEKIREIIDRYKKIHKSGLNLKYLKNFDDFDEDLKQVSMFKEKKLIIVENPFSDTNFKEKFLKSGKIFLSSNDIILIYQEGEINKNDSLFKFLKKNAACQEFKPLENVALKKWIIKECEKYNVKIEPAAVIKLVEYVNSDLWQMANEIKKLASYKFKQKIKEEDVIFYVRPKIETDIFKTIEAISNKNKKIALNLLHQHLKKGDSPFYLLTMISYQFRNLLIIKDFIEKNKPYNFILKRSGLPPFIIKKLYILSQKFTLLDLKKIYKKIFQLDLEMKTGKTEPEKALEIFIAQI